MQTMMSEKTGKGVDKTTRYGWVVKDEPGELIFLNKDILQVHPAYQREILRNKVKEITSNWSWVACGAIVVGERAGEFWVIDGQHRVVATKRRSDIKELPCVVFKTSSLKQEAVAFLDLNTGRAPVSSIGKFKAMVASENEAAIFVRETLEHIGIRVDRKAKGPNNINSIAWAIKKANEDEEKFLTVMSVAAEISTDISIQVKLLDGLWYINDRLIGGIKQRRFFDRLKHIGAKKLIDSANKASGYFGLAGAKIYATGILDAVNKGLKNKFELNATE